MRKLVATATAAIAAVSLAAAPAFADNSKNNNDRKPVRTVLEITGTLNAVAANSVNITVKTTSMGDATRDVANQVLAGKSLSLAVTSSTVIKRGTATGLASLVVGDRLNIRATCTTGPLACTAVRINATPAPVVLPRLTARGVVIGNTGGNVTMVVVTASTTSTNTFTAGSILGKQFTFATDTTTAVSGGTATSVATIPNYAAVNVAATCTTTTPAVCTAKRITVIVPTS